MRFTLQYPLNVAGYDPSFLQPQSVRRLAQAAEAAGLDAVAFTDHPAPSEKWRRGGGHHTLDPTAALAFCAAVTERVRLLTYLHVAPYRNPFLSGKELATVDVLSEGRLTIGLGAGYLRSEFRALGVDFDERGKLLDEAVAVWREIWTTDTVSYVGRHFEAVGQTARPWPVQTPHPPLWLGGNSEQARRRVVAYGQGWSPLLVDSELSSTIRTAALATPADLAVAVDQLHEALASAGHDTADVDVQVEWAQSSSMVGPVDQALETLEVLRLAGVTWVVLTPPDQDVGHAVETVLAYGEQVAALAG